VKKKRQMQKNGIKALKEIDRQVLAQLRAQGLLGPDRLRKQSAQVSESGSRMLPASPLGSHLEGEKPDAFELTRFAEFWPLAEADFRRPWQPLGSVVSRFCPSYDGTVTVDIKTKIGGGLSYAPKKLKALAIKLLRIAEDAEGYQWAARKSVSVRLY
jgi:hypothetical protein